MEDSCGGKLMPATSSAHQSLARCWVFFSGGQNGIPHWRGGWFGAPSTLGGIRIEHPDHPPSRVAEWRVVFEQPRDMTSRPEIPEGALWKLTPTGL